MGKQEKPAAKVSAAPVRNPQGGLPRKKRQSPTSGWIDTVDNFGEPKKVRYKPGKHIKSAHRRAMAERPVKISLRQFAIKEMPDGIVADWAGNKKSSGAGFTVVELVMTIAMLTGFIGVLAALYAAAHFLLKFW